MNDLQQLRETILKDGKVTKAKIVYSQKIYSNGTASPIKMSNQDVVEIGIEDLMQAITSTIEAEVAAAMAKFGIEKGVKYDVKKSDKVIVLTALQAAQQQDKEKKS